MTDLGREIPITDGRKPEWLADDEPYVPQGDSECWFDDERTENTRLDGHLPWDSIIAIRLRADHPFYKQEAEPMLTKEAVSKLTRVPPCVQCGARPYGRCLNTLSKCSSGHYQPAIKPAATPSFDTDKYVLVERMTEREWDLMRKALDPIAQFSIWLRNRGIIKPDPTSLERYMEQYPRDDRDTVARVMAWKESA